MHRGDVAIAVLAAGKAQRFGGKKLDRDCAGRPLGSWATLSAERAGFKARFLIVSQEPPDFIKTLDGWVCVTNPYSDSGLASSVRTAVHAARSHDRLVIALADMPLMEPEHLSALGSQPDIAFTKYPDGSRGVPAGFPAYCFDRLIGIDTGAAQVNWDPHAVTLVPAHSDSLIDVDTQEGLVAVSRLFAKR